jgi:hypothetical protein
VKDRNVRDPDATHEQLARIDGGIGPACEEREAPPMVFDYTRDYSAINFREHPELYQIGRGEQGVFLVEPYKSEILPYWRFRTPEVARESADTIYAMFLRYLDDGDLPGADMARKFLQMGWTRSRRYASYPGGRKYDRDSGDELPRAINQEKAESAAIFYQRYVQAREDPRYRALLQRHREQCETRAIPAPVGMRSCSTARRFTNRGTDIASPVTRRRAPKSQRLSN